MRGPCCGGSLSRVGGGWPCRSRGGGARHHLRPTVCPLLRCQDHVAEPPSARTQPQPSVSYLSILLGTTTLKDTATSSSSPQAVAETPPPKPTIYVKDPPDWYFSIYIRIDRSGSFHTYPHLGGPFKSLQDVEKAIERYLDDKRHKTLWNEQAGDSGMDIIIKRTNLAGGRALGTARERPAPNKEMFRQASIVDYTREQMSLMLQALLDKYNEDHNLVGISLSLSLSHRYDLLHYQSICEDYKWYKHFNFTTNTKDGIEDLFFAGVTEGIDDELVANCFCKIESNENGHCYGCINHGFIDMKHPDKADACSGGHLNVYLPFGGCRSPEEARLRYIYGIQ
ncbi:hypothetical protein VPH35_129079 [Triticum aestivum]